MTPQIRALFVLTAFTVPLAGCPGGLQGFPFVSDLNGAYRAEGPVGSTVIVEGIQFGDVQGASNFYFTNTLGGVALAAPVTSWSNNFIVAKVPTGAVSGPASVNNGNGPNQGLVTFTITPQAPFTPASLTLPVANPLDTGVSGHAVAFTILRGGTTPVRALYVTGGMDNVGTPLTNVYYATVPATGAPSAWTKSSSALPAGVGFHASVVANPGNSAVTAANGYLMVLGGATNSSGASTNQIYKAQLNNDGSLGTWAVAGTLPAQLHSFGATVYMGHLYIVGGQNGSNAPQNTVYRAVLQPDASLGTWNSQASLPFPRSHFGFGQFNGYLYVVGGDSGAIAPNLATPSASSVSDVTYAPVDLFSRNVLASPGWKKNANSLPAARFAETAVVAGAPGAGSLLVSAGLYTGAPTNEEVYAPIAADGSVGTFAVPSGGSLLNTACSCNLFNHAATGYQDGNGIFHVLVVGGDDQNTPGTKHKQTFTNP